VAALTWRENARGRRKPPAGGEAAVAAPGAANADKGGAGGTIEAWRMMRADPRILSIGAVEALFEGAMYVFVMQWPPALKAVVTHGEVPFGKVFSCLMASCMLGSSAFSGLLRLRPVEEVLAGALALAAGAMASAAASCRGSLRAVLASFFLFEACVGIYFPAMGVLRSRYVPDSHRGIMTAMSRVPLNLLVVAVTLAGQRLGLRGSLLCSCVALQASLLAQLRLCGGAAPMLGEAASS